MTPCLRLQNAKRACLYKEATREAIEEGPVIGHVVVDLVVRPECLEMLHHMEWQAGGKRNGKIFVAGFCPCCGSNNQDDHAVNCELAALLKEENDED